MTNLKADLRALVQAAAGVDGTGAELQAAHDLAGYCRDKGAEFGGLAQAAGLDAAHDEFNTWVLIALTEGVATMTNIADTMRGIARDFGVTDTDVADHFHTL